MSFVSVIIPSYNHAQFLKTRIQSILQQTYSDFEIIILEDCSTDGSSQILDEYRSHKKISHIVERKVNSGSPFGMWQQGFDLAAGDLIWIAESDDYADSEFLAKIVCNFDDPEIVLSHCKSVCVFRNIDDTVFTKFENFWDSFSDHRWNSLFKENGFTLFQKFGVYRCPVNNVSSAVFRKSVLSEIEIPSLYRYWGDWWFWSQIYVKGSVAFCPEYLNYITFHPLSATSRNQSSSKVKFLENIIVAKKVAYLAGKKLKYTAAYDWLIDYWLKEFQKTKKKVSVFFLPFLFLPLSFQVPFIIKLFHLYKRRFNFRFFF